MALIKQFAIPIGLHMDICNNIASNKLHIIAILFDLSYFANFLKMIFSSQTFAANDSIENNSE
jgi:hypothetical protein